VQRPPGHGEHLPAGAPAEFQVERLLLLRERLLPALPHGLDLLPDPLRVLAPPGLELGARLGQAGAALRLEGRGQLAVARAFGLRLAAQPGCVVELLADPRLARGHGAGDRPVQEPPQDPDQDQEVDDLGADGERIDEHAVIRPRSRSRTGWRRAARWR
jgi:hypothetical protein